jgi:PAS domain S-box-containing protein
MVEQRFREMIDALPAAIYTTDAEGWLTHFNPAAVEFAGRVPELGTDRWCVSWKLYHSDGTPMPHDTCPMAVALKEGRPVRGAMAIAERPDGTRAWFEPYPTPIRDSRGRIVGGINMIIDITDRKRVEDVAAYLAAIVESSEDAIISKNLQGVIQSWNKGAEKIFGYTAAETIGQPVTMLMPPERTEEEARILESINRGETVAHYETIRRRKDGTEIDISLTVSPIRNEAGQIIGASKIARDITDRRQAEADALHAARVGEHLYRLTSTSNASEDPVEVFAAAMDALHEVLGVDRSAILLFDPDGVLRFKAWRGLSEPYRSAVEGHSPWTPSTLDPQSIAVPDVDDDPGLASLRDVIGQEGIRALCFVPLVYQAKLIGKFMLYHNRPHVYTVEELRLAETVAGHVATGVGRRRITEQLARAERAERFLADASAELATSLSDDKALEIVARLAIPALADACVVYLADDHGKLGRAATAYEHPTKGILQEVDQNAGQPAAEPYHVRRVFETGQPAVVTGVYAAIAGTTVAERSPGSRLTMIVPLIARGQTIGVISFGTSQPDRRYDDADLLLAQELASRSATTIDNARLFRQQRTVAETLQHSLLPERLPQHPAISVAARYVPGSKGVNVGGDWYDVFDLPSGRVGLAIGDVVGRGVEAAALMGQVRNVMRAYAFDSNEPSAVVEQVNAWLRHHHPAARMVTALYAILDLAAGSLRFTSAGHLPPLVLDAGGARYVEEGRGVPLGVTRRARYSEATISLRPDTRILLYTDGLVDRRDLSLDDAMKQLSTLAAGMDGRPLNEMLDNILVGFLNGGVEDDVAVLGLRLAPLQNESLMLLLPAEPESLAHVRVAVREWLKGAALPSEAVPDVITAVGEAASNVVTHAYGIAKGEMEIEGRRTPTELVITVRDFGRWRESASGSGWGTRLMRALVDSVEVDTPETGTVIRLRKRLQAAPVS